MSCEGNSADLVYVTRRDAILISTNRMHAFRDEV